MSAISTVLITGCSSGFGLETARYFLDKGWHVVATMRTPREGLLPRSDRLRVLALDVTDADSIRRCVEDAGPIDALVNNAGVYGAARGPDGVARTIETNFFGPLRVTLGVLPLLRDGATITNVTSELGALANLDAAHRRVLADPALTRDALVARLHDFVRGGGTGWGTDAYGVSKAALNALTRILAVELAPRQIRVNATCPGWVRTDMGGRGAPRSVEHGAASVLFGVTATTSGGIFRDGAPIAP